MKKVIKKIKRKKRIIINKSKLSTNHNNNHNQIGCIFLSQNCYNSDNCDNDNITKISKISKTTKNFKKIIIKNSYKPLKINTTKIYCETIDYNCNCNYFNFKLYNKNKYDLNSLINKVYKIDVSNIKEKIRIYNKNNIELYIILLIYDYNYQKSSLKTHNLINMFSKDENCEKCDIYSSILKFNKNKNSSKYYLTDTNKYVSIDIKDIYYYLIGYIKG